LIDWPSAFHFEANRLRPTTSAKIITSHVTHGLRLAKGKLDESKLTLRELAGIREALINSLITIYHPRIDYPGFNVPMPIDRVASEGPGVTYERPADVPINPSGEVEDEAITRKA